MVVGLLVETHIHLFASTLAREASCTAVYMCEAGSCFLPPLHRTAPFILKPCLAQVSAQGTVCGSAMSDEPEGATAQLVPYDGNVYDGNVWLDQDPWLGAFVLSHGISHERRVKEGFVDMYIEHDNGDAILVCQAVDAADDDDAQFILVDDELQMQVYDEGVESTSSYSKTGGPGSSRTCGVSMSFSRCSFVAERKAWRPLWGLRSLTFRSSAAAGSGGTCTSSSTACRCKPTKEPVGSGWPSVGVCG